MPNRSNTSLKYDGASAKEDRLSSAPTENSIYHRPDSSPHLPSLEPGFPSRVVHLQGEGGDYLEIKIDKEGNVGWRKSLGRRKGKTLLGKSLQQVRDASGGGEYEIFFWSLLWKADWYFESQKK